MGPTPTRPSLVERLVRGYGAYAVGRVAYGIVWLVLMPVVLAISIAIFAAVGAIVYGSWTLFGSPGPPIGAIVGWVWFIGSFAILFLVLRRGHRWLTRALALADAPAAMIDPPFEEPFIAEVPDVSTFHDRLAVADARHGPPSDRPDAP